MGTLIADVRGADGFRDARLGSWESFRLNGSGRSDLLVEVATTDERFTLAPGAPPPDAEIVRVDRDTEVITARALMWTASFDLRQRSVTAELCEPWPGALESLMKTIVQVYTVAMGAGLVLHASCLRRDDGAYVFFGASGAGKSTLATLSRDAGEAEILSDEMTFVTGFDDELGLRVVTMPFRQRNEIVIQPQQAPLRGLFALEQAPDDRIESIPISGQVTLLGGSTAIGLRDALLARPAIDVVAETVRRVPVRRLHFTRSAAFWARIDLAG